MCDAMAIRREIEWDAARKVHVGFVDFGDGPVDEVEATEALVFMAVGLVGSWKIPVGYILIKCKAKEFV